MYYIKNINVFFFFFILKFISFKLLLSHTIFSWVDHRDFFISTLMNKNVVNFDEIIIPFNSLKINKRKRDLIFYGQLWVLILSALRL